MTDVTIAATVREKTGKGNCRKLRRDGWVPGNIIRGRDEGSLLVSLEPKWLSRAWKGGKTFTLSLEGQEPRQVAIKELQIDPVRRRALHVDMVYV